MPCQSTVFDWLAAKRGNFLEQYARAREAQAEHIANEILEIADDGSNDTYIDDEGNVRTDHDVVSRSRLRVDARKWWLSKVLPKKYGDFTRLQHSGPDDGPIEISAAAQPDEIIIKWVGVNLPLNLLPPGLFDRAQQMIAEGKIEQLPSSSAISPGTSCENTGSGHNAADVVGDRPDGM